MMTEYNTRITHIITIEGERFQIYHKERRLYAFVDWKGARESLIKIMLKKIYEKTGNETAYISFKMANPMRISRLGNFFIDIRAEIMYRGRSLGSVEALGLNKIFVNHYITIQEEEIDFKRKMDFEFSRKNKLIVVGNKIRSHFDFSFTGYATRYISIH
ncbi:hypothetical protein [Flavobacterium praedii]|uniref:hypothetical protein n=1 Tax=Flavobacterium praedii TaxID=3002900 RepID=UPI002481B2CD|nr:hypothetical protein [Flavobacterium praedii]